MRAFILLASTAMLAACGGAGPQTIGSTPPPTGGGGSGGGGSGSGDPVAHTFVDPQDPKTYEAIGASHSYAYTVQGAGQPGAGQGSQLYQGDATTARNTDFSIAYDPRDAIFNVSFSNALAGTSATSRFQDPLHRTDFGGVVEPQFGTPNLAAGPWNLAGINYLESGSSNNVVRSVPNEFVFSLIDESAGGSYDSTTFFYQTPGTDTQYVTFAGYLRNRAAVSSIEIDNGDGTTTDVLNQNNTFERGAFAYGEVTGTDNVPTTGTGTFNGTMLASMVFNDQPDTNGNFDTYFQWIAGDATTSVNFGANTFSLSLDGIVGAPLFDGTSRQHTIQENALFRANGGGTIDLVRAGGFFGQFDEAWFVNPGGNRFDLFIAGSSIDGTFYGPNADEVGGGYRIVGGTPDERIDILGTFVGKKN